MPESKIQNLKSKIAVGGVILAGGKSSRMGLPKATLPFGPELMLQRVVRLLSTVVHPLVVVSAPGQELPSLPNDVMVTFDERGGRGPLQGLAAGLSAISPHADAAYATSCDVPLLKPSFVQAMIDRLANADIAVPEENGFAHPLAAVYRTSVLLHIHELLAVDRLRPAFLFERTTTNHIPVGELRTVDPALLTLRNLNRPEDYRLALTEAGFELVPAIAAALGHCDT